MDFEDDFNAGGYDGFGRDDDYNIWEENQLAGEDEDSGDWDEPEDRHLDSMWEDRFEAPEWG